MKNTYAINSKETKTLYMGSFDHDTGETKKWTEEVPIPKIIIQTDLSKTELWMYLLELNHDDIEEQETVWIGKDKA